VKNKRPETLTSNKPKLLIIDDSKRILSTLTEFLTKNDFDVVPVSNGLDGIKALENNEQRFDLVITDIVIPDISGIGIISIVKKRYKDIPVIGVTGWGTQPQALATEVQADAVIEKPFDLFELKKVIDNLITKTKKKGQTHAGTGINRYQ